MQNRAAKQADHDGDDHCERRREPEAVGDEAAQPVLVALAELLRHGDDEAIADADAEAEDKEVDRAGRADARQRVYAEIAPDNERFAHDINAHFIQKSSKHYSTELRYNVSKLFGFGDFVIINPQSGEEIMRITDLKDLQKKIFDIP